MFSERTVSADTNHVFTRILFQFLGTNTPVQYKIPIDTEYFNSNVETESAEREGNWRKQDALQDQKDLLWLVLIQTHHCPEVY
jgi:hypothetical protein